MNTHELYEIVEPIVRLKKHNELLMNELSGLKEKLEAADEEVRLLIDHIEHIETKLEPLETATTDTNDDELEKMAFVEKFFELEKRRGQAWPEEFARDIINAAKEQA